METLQDAHNSGKSFYITIDDVVEAAIHYQQILYTYINSHNKEKIVLDFKDKIKNRDTSCYILKIIDGFDNNMKLPFLPELFYVYLYDNISNSHMAKKIILSLCKNKNDNYFSKIFWEYTTKAEKDEELITLLAQLLFELNKKNELNSFTEIYKDILSNTGFIE